MFSSPAIEPWNRLAKLLCLVLVALILIAACVNGQSQDPKVLKLYSEAKAAQAAGDLATAAAKYESILKLQPHLAAAYNNLGLPCFQQREYKKAAAKWGCSFKIDSYFAAAVARSPAACAA